MVISPLFMYYMFPLVVYKHLKTFAKVFLVFICLSVASAVFFPIRFALASDVIFSDSFESVGTDGQTFNNMSGWTSSVLSGSNPVLEDDYFTRSGLFTIKFNSSHASLNKTININTSSSGSYILSTDVYRKGNSSNDYFDFYLAFKQNLVNVCDLHWSSDSGSFYLRTSSVDNNQSDLSTSLKNVLLARWTDSSNDEDAFAVHLELDTTNNRCRSSVVDKDLMEYFTDWVYFSADYSINLAGVRMDTYNSGNKYIDSLELLSGVDFPSGNIYETYYPTNKKTQIYNSYPGMGNNTSVATTTSINLGYYINSQDIGYLSTPYIKIELSRSSDGLTEKFYYALDNPSNYNTPATTTIFTTLTASNNVFVSISAQLLNNYPIIPDTPLSPSFFTTFYTGSIASSSTEYWDNRYDEIINGGGTIYDQTVGSVNCDIDFPFGKADFACMFRYILSFIIPSADAFGSEIKSLVSRVLYLPPWGYATQLYTSLINPAVGTVYTTVPISFPVGSPAHGLSLNLNLSDGLDKFESTLSDNVTILGYSASYFDQFMKYWSWMWYILFFLWLLREFFDNYSVSSDNHPYHISKGHTINMRHQRSGTLKINKY